jgi:prevent-host-death family protein
MAWQVQEAKQRFSEFVERAQREGPQIVTKHGKPVAVLVDFERYRSLTSDGADFKAFLRSVPAFEPPARDVARHVEL